MKHLQYARRELRVLFTDSETTGLTPKGDRAGYPTFAIGTDRLCSFGILAVSIICDDYHVVTRMEQIVNPGRKLSVEAAKVNGMKDADLEVQPPFPMVCYNLRDAWAWADIVCGHNIRFDLGFYAMELKEAGFAPLDKRPLLDTKLVAVDHPMGLPGLALTKLTAHYGIVHSAHSALGDCDATLAVLRRMAEAENAKHATLEVAIKRWTAEQNS